MREMAVLPVFTGSMHVIPTEHPAGHSSVATVTVLRLQRVDYVTACGCWSHLSVITLYGLRVVVLLPFAQWHWLCTMRTSMALNRRFAWKLLLTGFLLPFQAAVTRRFTSQSACDKY